ncbi:ankyrin [Lojkania enalia]|uniref:Ankyrin n=1 Tax=Lojkania enalia TaxID=147567 RepID=A0A9P4MZV7_9PLEO|nr:ankyrin [Didymosphaeria enalia]
MDPYSIIASSLTISETVIQSLRVISSLRKAPVELRSLVNEVSDFQAVLAEIQAAYLHRVNYDLRPLERLFTKANSKLLQLKSIAEKCFRPKGSNRRTSIFYRIRWIQEKDTVLQIRRELSEAKLDIIAAWGAANSLDLTRVLLRIESMSIVTTPVLVQSESRLDPTSPSIARAENTPALTYLEDICPKLDVDTMIEEVDSDYDVPSKSSMAQKESQVQSLVTKSGNEYSNAIGIYLQVSQLRSRVCHNCSCNYHRISQFRTPAHLNKFLGTLFVGYTALPFFSPSCNRRDCRRGDNASLRFRYYFPSWFLMRVFSLMASVSNMNGPELVIKVPRACDPKADILLYAGNGNIDGIKMLFKQGLASPFDEEYGTGVSILQRAVDNRQMEVVKLLLSAGSDPFHEDRFYFSPAENMLQLAFTGDVSEQGEFNQLIRSLEMDIFNRFQLTVLHKIVLKLADLDLRSFLAVTDKEVNEPDSAGQTPLFWAATQGDSVAVELLLRHGANPCATSKLGETALHWAIEGKENACTKLLLQYGADPSARNCLGTTPLHYAAWTHADPSVQLLPLVMSKVEVNVRNHKGQTPLHYAIWNDMVWPAAFLVEHHASLEIEDNEGYTPLLFALLHNRLNAAIFLLEAGANVLARTKNGDTVLHVAAAHGDIPMFRALEQRHPHAIEIFTKNDKGHSPSDVLSKRPDKTLSLVVVFEHLLSVLSSLDSSETSWADSSKDSSADQFSTPPEYAEVVQDLAKLSVEKATLGGVPTTGTPSPLDYQ